MKKVLLIGMWIIVMGLAGCFHDFHDRDRYGNDRGRYEHDRDRHDQDRGHDYEHRDRDNDDHEHHR